MKKSKYMIVFMFFVTLSLLTTICIFSNSMKNGRESNAQSQPIVEAVERVLDPQDKLPTKVFNYIVRKSAHIIEFSVLGLLLAGGVWCIDRMKCIQSGNDLNWCTVIAMLIGLAIAATDEMIQSFTGRTNSATDVLIDFTGVIIGMGIVMFIKYRYEKSVNRLEKQEMLVD